MRVLRKVVTDGGIDGHSQHKRVQLGPLDGKPQTGLLLGELFQRPAANPGDRLIGNV